MKNIDYQKLFEACPGDYLILAPNQDFTILAATKSRLETTKTQIEHISGKPLFDIFPDNPNDPSANGVANLRASLHRVLTNKCKDEMPVQKYDIRKPTIEGGEFVEKYWKPVNIPVLNPEGSIEYIIHWVQDVTEVIKLGQSQINLSSAIQLIESERTKLFSIFGVSPVGIAILRGKNLTFEYANSSFRTLLSGSHALDGLPLNIALNDVYPSFLEKATHTYDNHIRTSIDEISTSLLLSDQRHNHVLRIIFEPFKSQTGYVDGVIVFVLEISAMMNMKRELLNQLESIQCKNSTRDMYIEEVVHNLRNCLSILYLDAKIISEEAAEEIVKVHTHKLLNSFERINKLLDHLPGQALLR